MASTPARPNARVLSLAAGTVLDTRKADTVRVAATAGFDTTGLWIEPDEWRHSDSAQVRRALDDTGLGVLDVEVVWIRPGKSDDEAHRTIAIGGEIGAAHVLVVSAEPDRAATAARFAGLCERAADAGLRAVIEFMRFTTVPTLAAALDVVARAGHPAGAVLVDTLHLARTGEGAGAVAALEPMLLPYLQLCDAAAVGPGEDNASLISEAIDLRRNPGEGELALGPVLDAMGPATPLSMEIRSADLRARFPDPADRAKSVYRATTAFLAARAEGKRRLVSGWEERDQDG